MRRGRIWKSWFHKLLRKKDVRIIAWNVNIQVSKTELP